MWRETLSQFILIFVGPIDDVPSDVDKSVGSMGRTIGIAVGCAAAYIVLVVGLMIYCKGRRARQAKRAEVLAPECENCKGFLLLFWPQLFKRCIERFTHVTRSHIGLLKQKKVFA